MSLGSWVDGFKRTRREEGLRCGRKEGRRGKERNQQEMEREREEKALALADPK